MNLTRRLQLLAGVVLSSTAAGAASGLVVASLMLSTRLGHVHAASIWELVKLGSQSGALLGALLGPPVILGFLRRAPLRRVLTDVFLGATYGGTVGFALSHAFAQPRPEVSLILAGSVAGFSFAALRLRAQFSKTPASAPLTSAAR